MDRVTDASPPPGPHRLPEDPADSAPEALGAPELPAYAERVLTVAETIPPGRVMTYGDVAEWLGEGGPRQVGRVMALYGGAVPWWRVVRADGVFLPGRERAALGHYREEGTPLRTAGPAADGHVPRIAMARARWDGLPLVKDVKEGDEGGAGDEEPGGSPVAEGAPRSRAKGARGGAWRVKRAT
ncbi:MGMT family protein [Streptomyces sp. NPDC021100]|uniref:MGMT family protein n=1 Tax=Streptomyces sp. NPDC021100 TaxID=3365114 RepID=UPI0037AAA61A